MSAGPLPPCLQQLPGVVLLLSPDGIVRASNGVLDAAVGRSLAGAHLTEVLDSTFVERCEDLLDKLKHSGSMQCWELLFTVEGTLDLRTFLAVRSDAEGAPVFWLLEHPVDPNLARSMEELAGLHRDLVEAQRELGREGRRLARALDRAERAIRTRDDVLAVVTHDLRNPVNTIAMATELLEMSATQAREREQLAVIRRSATRMSRLLGDLLDIGALEAGRFSLEPGPLDLRPVLEEVVRDFEAEARRKDQTLGRELAAGLPTVSADRDRILQVLYNLVGNAVKFTPGGGAITLQAETGDGEVIVSVHDTGPGISPPDQRRIFERFWHAPTTFQGGSGLGLAIAKGIVERHGGRIWVESGAGEGSTFRFTLPVADAPVTEAAG